jgi:hypothetical protein
MIIYLFIYLLRYELQKSNKGFFGGDLKKKSPKK